MKRPWLAAVLSLFLPGVVHAYLGHVRRGAAVYAVMLAVGLLVMGVLAAILMLPSRPIFIAGVTLAFGIVFGFVAFLARDAYHLARRPSPGRRRTGAALLFLVAGVLLSEVLVQPVSRCLVRAYKLPSASMAPTLLVGDHMLVDPITFGARYRWWSVGRTIARFPALDAPRPGDVVVLVSPRDASQEFVKRVVAVAGETVEMRDERLYVGGAAVDEPFAQYRRGGVPLSSRFGPVAVPPGAVFVMGDNRDESADSRLWGPVPVENVIGLVRALYWSWDADGSSVRWSRVGQPVSRVRRSTTAPPDHLQAATSARVASAGSPAARMARTTATP